MEYIYAYISRKNDKKKILCRCGFKFIRFTSKIFCVGENSIVYRGKKYDLNSQNKLYIEIKIVDIVNETLTDILVKNFELTDEINYYSDESNERNFNKFIDDYNQNSKKTSGISFHKYSDLDIIDLLKINEIRYSSKASNDIKSSKILEITKKKNIFYKTNTGLTKATLESNKILDNKFYYAFIPNENHFLTQMNNEMILVIDNKSFNQWDSLLLNANKGEPIHPQSILLIKFNKKNLASYLRKKVISKLRN